jgi:sugar lactone lactonase YvrE
VIRTRLLARVAISLVAILLTSSVLGHPGSGIVVDRRGNVYFTDTGLGVWKIDKQGRLSRHPGTALHFMAIDLDGRLVTTRWPVFREPSAVIERVGADPTLLLGSDFPLTVGRDGSLYYPDLGGDDRVQVIRVTPSGGKSALATLPSVSDGKPLRWLNGIAAGPDGFIYYSEDRAVRRISPQGVITTIADGVSVPDCVQFRGSSHLGPWLRGLDVARDGTVYVAASGCHAALKIAATGTVTPILRTVTPWTPTGVAVQGKDVYVLEYFYTESNDRRDWIPRVRKLSGDGRAQIVATVERGR